MNASVNNVEDLLFIFSVAAEPSKGILVDRQTQDQGLELSY
jgi:hypothetical protein